MRVFVFICSWFLLNSALCQDTKLMILGVAQDAGYPQALCSKSCCKTGLYEPVVSLAVLSANDYLLFEASPDINAQMRAINQKLNNPEQQEPSGVFLTHAHIGHYTGLMHFGREAVGASKVPVYCMPKMAEFLKKNGPWSQLVKLKNIQLSTLENGKDVSIKGVQVRPLLVPHRDEFSETVGYVIKGNKKSALFIPDIDKWSKWDTDLIDVLTEVDYAFVDGTFYNEGELPGRDMSEIPHPFVVETMNLLNELPAQQKEKMYFIHFNHTNPLMWDENAKSEVRKKGFNVSKTGMIFEL